MMWLEAWSCTGQASLSLRDKEENNLCCKYYWSSQTLMKCQRNNNVDAQHGTRVYWVSKPVFALFYSCISLCYMGTSAEQYGSHLKAQETTVEHRLLWRKKAKRKIAAKFVVIIVTGSVCAYTHPSFVSPLCEGAGRRSIYILSIDMLV